ncbi:MAG: hypothetical protein ACKO3C_04320, partial [Betaproteobacteria bacterium]
MKVHPWVFNAVPRVKMQGYLQALIERDVMANTRLLRLRALIEREVIAITRLFYLRALIEREGMAITRLFKRGNSQAVCIPAELAFS